MTHLIEILLIVSIITSVIMLMLLIILKVGVTVTSRPLTKEKIEKLASGLGNANRRLKILLNLLCRRNRQKQPLSLQKLLNHMQRKSKQP